MSYDEASGVYTDAEGNRYRLASAGGGMLSVAMAMPILVPIDDNIGPQTYEIGKGDSFWNIAKQQLGEGATNADILAYTQQLMEVNPGLDPRLLQVGATIQLPSGNEVVSATTMEAYGQSDAEYREYLAQAQAQAQMIAPGGLDGTAYLTGPTGSAGSPGGFDWPGVPDSAFGSAAFAAEYYGKMEQIRTYNVTGRTMTQMSAVAQNNFFVNAAGEAVPGYRINVSGVSAGHLSVDYLGTDSVFSRNFNPGQTSIYGQVTESSRLVTSGSAAQFSQIRDVDALVTVSQSNSSFLARSGEILGNRYTGGLVSMGLNYLQDGGRDDIDTTRFWVARGLDFTAGVVNTVVSTKAGVAAAAGTSFTGPIAVGVGVTAGFATSELLDRGYQSIRDPLIDKVTGFVDYGIDVGKTVVDFRQNPAEYVAKWARSAKDYYDDMCLWNCK